MSSLGSMSGVMKETGIETHRVLQNLDRRLSSTEDSFSQILSNNASLTVSSIREGISPKLVGDVTLQEAGGTDLSQAGNTIIVDSIATSDTLTWTAEQTFTKKVTIRTSDTPQLCVGTSALSELRFSYDGSDFNYTAFAAGTPRHVLVGGAGATIRASAGNYQLRLEPDTGYFRINADDSGEVRVETSGDTINAERIIFEEPVFAERGTMFVIDTKSANFTIPDPPNDVPQIIIGDTNTVGAFTVTLPDLTVYGSRLTPGGSNFGGRPFTVVNAGDLANNASSNSITVQPKSGQKLNGVVDGQVEVTSTAGAPVTSVKVMNDSTANTNSWWIVEG